MNGPATLPALAVIVAGGFIAVTLWLVAHPQAEMSQAAMLALGGLGSAFTSIVGFYFGSSVGSRQKDEARK